MSLSKEEMRKLLWCNVCCNRHTANLGGVCHECLGGNRLIRTGKEQEMLNNTTKECNEAYERHKERIETDLLRMGERKITCTFCQKEYFTAHLVVDCPDCKRQKQETRKTKLYEDFLLSS